VVGGIAAGDARTTASNWTILQAAAVLDKGLPLDPKTIHHLRTTIASDSSDPSCRADVVHASLLIVLSDLDNQDVNADYDGWAESAAAAEKFLRHAIACLPGDGDLWLRYAMVRFKSGEIPSEQVEMMRMSQTLAPAEGGTVLGRLSHWNRLSAPTLEKAAPLVTSDLQNALLYFASRTLKAPLENLSPQLTPYVADVAHLLPAERQDYFAKSGIVLPQAAVSDPSKDQKTLAPLWFRPAWPEKPPAP
jgi:hypothetical protein